MNNQNLTSDINWEVIVVDNASTDNTAEAAARLWREIGGRTELRVLREPRPGVTRAREKGVAAARHEYIIFCDDDNWLDHNYLQRAIETMAENHAIGALGGRSTAVGGQQHPFPPWFEDCKSDYAVGRQGRKSGDVSARKYLWGAGLTTRKELMEKVFDPSFPMLLEGRKGTCHGAGEDSEICARLLLMSYRLYYDENLFFQHFIPANRLTCRYRKKQLEGFAQSYRVLPLYFNCIENLQLSRYQLLKRTAAATLKSCLPGRTMDWQWMGYLRDQAAYFEGNLNLIYRFYQNHR